MIFQKKFFSQRIVKKVKKLWRENLIRNASDTTYIEVIIQLKIKCKKTILRERLVNKWVKIACYGYHNWLIHMTSVGWIGIFGWKKRPSYEGEISSDRFEFYTMEVGHILFTNSGEIKCLMAARIRETMASPRSENSLGWLVKIPFSLGIVLSAANGWAFAGVLCSIQIGEQGIIYFWRVQSALLFGGL